MKKLLTSILTLVFLLGAANLCPAETAKPFLTVSFSGYDKLFESIGSIGELGGNPDIGKGFELMLMFATQGKGLEGLDKKQPWGVVVMNDGQKKYPTFGFIPVTDLKKLIESAQGIPQLADSIKSNNDVFEINIKDKQKIFVQQKGKWAFFSNKSDNLAQVPADPEKLLGDLPKQYNLAVRLSAKDAPKEYRELLVNFIKAKSQMNLKQMPGESDEQFALRKNTVKQSVQQLTTLVNELEDIVLGWNIASSNHTTYLDLKLTAQSGTKLAFEFDQIKIGKTNFSGVMMPDAAVTANWAGVISESSAARAKSNLATFRVSILKELERQGLSEDQAKTASKLLGQIIEVIEKTIDSKKNDGGLVLLLNPEGATAVVGGAVENGAKLNDTLKQLVEEIKKIDEKLAKFITLNADAHQGIQFHVVSVPTPDEKLATLVGDNLEVVIGVSNDKLWLSAGRDAAKTLKSVIDQSKLAGPKEVPPMRISVSLRQIAKFLAEVSENAEVKNQATLFTAVLEKAEEKDHVVLTSKPIDRGVHLRLEVEEGVLKSLVYLSQMVK